MAENEEKSPDWNYEDFNGLMNLEGESNENGLIFDLDKAMIFCLNGSSIDTVTVVSN